MNVTALANQSTGILSWWRAFVGAAAMVAAGAIAWAVLTQRVEAAEATLSAHGAQITNHAERIRTLEDGSLDMRWNIYLVCKRQAEQSGRGLGDCRQPGSR